MDEPVLVGRYQVQTVLGKGAMGVVYLANDPQIGRRVALKTIRPIEGARPEEIEESRARFLREARAAGKLIHPNIVTIFDVFEDHQTLYIAMEYVEGTLMDAFCSRRHLLPQEQVLELAAQALSGLDYAHRQGIVHRDIKPSNLMVVEGQTLKIMDFGLARESGAHLSHHGTLIGTPHTMSPEQVQGKDLDGRSDVFSMGTVLYELLTGEKAFQGDTISTVIYKVVNEEPPPVRAVNHKIPEALSQVIRKAMAKKREDRFPTAKAFREALLHPPEPDALQSWAAAESVPQRDPRLASLAFLPPAPAKDATSKRHTLSRKYARFVVLALLIVAGGALAVNRYMDASGLKGTAVKPPPSQEVLPKVLEVVTAPPGAQLFLDGTAVDAVTLAPSDAKVHVVEARLGCVGAKAQVTGASLKGKLQLSLVEGPYEFPVTSTPPEAKIIVNGADTGLRAPANLPRQGCQPFSLSLDLPGHDPFQVTVDPQKTARIEATLTTEASHGSLKVICPSGILQVYEGERLLGISGQILSLPPGERTLRLVAPGLRGSREEKATVESWVVKTLKVEGFATGRVFLYGRPANDGRVIVDGARYEDLPLNGTSSLAVGAHDFLVVSPEGRKVHFSWEIRQGDQTRIVDFSTGRVAASP